MKDVNNINSFIEELEFLKKSNSLLEEVCNYLDPYDKTINGKDTGSLVRKIHEHLYSFDDSE